MPRKKIPMSERTHGTTSTYQAGCRCDECKAAQARYAKERYEARKDGDVRKPGAVEHGSRGMYAKGCRCDECKAASAAYRREYDRRRRAERPGQPLDADGAEVMRELRMSVCCPNCGGDVVQQTPQSRTASGMRVTVMLRCTKQGCSRQWQFVGVLMSLSGSEYMGAA